MTFIHRQEQAFFASWLARQQRKPLLLRGARQVGKSTLVRKSAADLGIPLAEINVEEHRTFLRTAFDSLNLDKILAACSNIVGYELHRDLEHPIVFLDEIQALPSALQSLRYWYERAPQLPVVAAGSLLEFVFGTDAVPMPVGRVEALFMSPLLFKEFVQALGRQDLVKTLSECLPWKSGSLSVTQHAELWRHMREFLLVGGLPEATAAFISSKDKDRAQEGRRTYADVQRNLVIAYRDDIQKYPASAKIRDLLREVYDRIPGQVAKKIVYTRLATESQSRDIKRAVGMLLDAGIIAQAIHSDANGIPLAAEQDLDTRKLFHLDVGLLCAQLGLRAKDLARIQDDDLVNEGALAEQFVAQELIAAKGAQERRLCHYWLREKQAVNAEVDFLMELGANVIPIEVKAGAKGRMRSLMEFVKLRKPRLVFRLDANLMATQDFAGATTLLSLPLYLAGEIGRIADAWFEEH